MNIIDQHIETVKEQIEYFDYRLNKTPKETATKVKFWPLKYKFDQLLNHLQDEKQNFSTPRPSISSSNSFNTLTVRNNKEIFDNDDSKIKRSYTPRSESLKIEEAILDIVKNHPEGIHKNSINESLINNCNICINESKLANILWKMNSKRGLLANMKEKKGFYSIKK